jgi:hypothetical protein
MEHPEPVDIRSRQSAFTINIRENRLVAAQILRVRALVYDLSPIPIQLGI